MHILWIYFLSFIKYQAFQKYWAWHIICLGLLVDMHRKLSKNNKCKNVKHRLQLLCTQDSTTNLQLEEGLTLSTSFVGVVLILSYTITNTTSGYNYKWQKQHWIKFVYIVWVFSSKFFNKMLQDYCFPKMLYLFEGWKNNVEEGIGFKGLLAFIAFITISKKIVHLLFYVKHVCLTYIIPRVWPSMNFVEKYGKWAVVTGCTQGIGYAYATELAARGMDIVLVSRNLLKLQDCANMLEQNHGMDYFDMLLMAIGTIT